MIRGAKTTAPPVGLKLVASLRALGVTLNEALLVVYLSGVEVAITREIEAGTGLRQPEVSIGMKVLGSRDWIWLEKIKSGTKGRLAKVYALKVALAEIVMCLEAKKAHDTNQAMISIQKLRELAPSL